VTSGPDVDQAPAPAEVSAVSDQTVDYLAERMAERKPRREAERKRDAARGGPCSRCGCVVSWERNQRGVLGRWHSDQHGPICVPCWDGGLAEGSARDVTQRAKGIRAALGTTPVPARVGPGYGAAPAERWWYDGPLVERAGVAFAWWYEAGAPAGQGEARFGHVDLEALLANLWPERTPQPTVRGDKCATCRHRDWYVHEVPVSAVPQLIRGTEVTGRPHIRVERRCANCGHVAQPEIRYTR
jgi:hypothetical protein